MFFSSLALVAFSAPLFTVAAPLAVLPLPALPTAPLLPQAVSLPQIPASRPLVMAYYPDWASETLAPEHIDFSRVDWVDFAFAVPDENLALTWDDPALSPDLLKRLVQAAHASEKSVKLSIGGWTGSKHFSTAVSTEANRRTFASNVLKSYSLYSLDGIDIDWEYPGQQGSPGNSVSSSDTANFLSFLQLLRALLPANAKITAATQTVPFIGNDGNPLTDMSEFAKVLDWVLLMNYDTWGSSSTPGPNAPLFDNCMNSTQPSANAQAGLETWSAAGFPPSQIVLGVPAYGYISRSTVNSLRTRQTLQSTAYTMAVNEEGGADNGQVQFRELVKQGVLQRVNSSVSSFPDDIGGHDQFALTFSPSEISLSSTTISSSYSDVSSFEGARGFVRYWDDCSSTPFLKSTQSEQVITYDDTQSLEMKAVWARQAGVLGVNMFDIHGDTDKWELLNSIIKGLDQTRI